MAVSTDMLGLTPGNTVQKSPESPLPRTLLSMHGPPANSVGCSTTIDVSLLHDDRMIKSAVEDDVAHSGTSPEDMIDDPQLIDEPIQNEPELNDADSETMVPNDPPPPHTLHRRKYPTTNETNSVDDSITIKHEEGSELQEIQAVDADTISIESPCTPAIEVLHVPAVKDNSEPSCIDNAVILADHIPENNAAPEEELGLKQTEEEVGLKQTEEEVGLKQAVGDFFSNILPNRKSSENLSSKETGKIITPGVTESPAIIEPGITESRVIVEPGVTESRVIPSPCPPRVATPEESKDEKEDAKSPSPSAIDKFLRKFSMKSTELESSETMDVFWTPEYIDGSEVSHPNSDVFEKEPLPHIPGKCTVDPLEPGAENDMKSTFDKFVDIFSIMPEEDAIKEVIEPEGSPAGPLDVSYVPPTVEAHLCVPIEQDVKEIEDMPIKEITVDIPVSVSTEELEPAVKDRTSEDAKPVTAATAVDALGNFFSNILPTTKSSECHPSTENIPIPVEVNVVERPTITIEAEDQFSLAAVEIVSSVHSTDDSRRSSPLDKIIHRFSLSTTPDTSMEDDVIIDLPVTPVQLDVSSPVNSISLNEKEMANHSAPDNDRKSTFGQIIGIFSKPKDDSIKDPVIVPSPSPTGEVELQKERIDSSLSLEVDNDKRSVFGGFIGKIDVAFFGQSNEGEEVEEHTLEVDPALSIETEDTQELELEVEVGLEPKKVQASDKMTDFFTGILKPLDRIREEEVQEETVKKTRTTIRIKSSVETEEVVVVESLMDFIKKDIKKKNHGDDDPFMVCDLSQVFERKLQWDHQFPGIIMFYNLNAFNTLSIRVLLNALHCGFVCANWTDVENSLSIGVAPQKIVYQQPFKEKATLRRIVARGILIVCYTTSDIRLIGEMALELEVTGHVLVQIDVSGSNEMRHPVIGGALPADLADIITEACRLGVNIIGISLDVSTGMSMNGCIIAKQVWRDLETHCSPSLIHIGGICNENGLSSEVLVLLEHFEDIIFAPHIFVIGDLKGYLTKTSVSLVSCITDSKETNNILHLVLRSHINNDLWDSKPYLIQISKDASTASSRQTAVWDTSLRPPVILDNTLHSMQLGDWVVFSEAEREIEKVKIKFVCSTPCDEQIMNLLDTLYEVNKV